MLIIVADQTPGRNPEAFIHYSPVHLKVNVCVYVLGLVLAGSPQKKRWTTQWTNVSSRSADSERWGEFYSNSGFISTVLSITSGSSNIITMKISNKLDSNANSQPLHSVSGYLSVWIVDGDIVSDVCDNVSLSLCQSTVGDGSGRHWSEEHQVVAALDFPFGQLLSQGTRRIDQLFLPVHRNAQTSCLTWSLLLAVTFHLCRSSSC